MGQIKAVVFEKSLSRIRSRDIGSMENGMSREGNLVRGDRKVGRRPRGVTLIAILLFLYAAAHVGLIVLAVVNPETLRTS